MERFVRGDIIVIPFPFSDLSNFKRRPALVLTDLDGEDIIILQMTSKNRNKKYSIKISESDFKKGLLNIDSFVRCDRLYTLDKNIILKKIGNEKTEKYNKVLDKVISILKNNK